MGINDSTAPAGTPLYFVPDDCFNPSAEVETGCVGMVGPGLAAWTDTLVYVQHDRFGPTFIRREHTFLTRDAADAVLNALRRICPSARALAA